MGHHLGKPVRLVWGPEHVHMVRPQHIGMDDTVIGHCSSVQTLQVHLIIIRMKEDRLAIVPALDDVLRHVDQGIARGARHRRPQNEGPQRYISLITFGLYQGLQENPSLTPDFQFLRFS